MRYVLFFVIASFFLFCGCHTKPPKIFDVHLHGSKDAAAQIKQLQDAGVYKAAISSSWDQQNNYRQQGEITFLQGLMFPCPNGKVPYSLQPCYENGAVWPDTNWVEQQIKLKKIDFLGEVLSQYHGIAPSNDSLLPYYRLAEKHHIPVGMHTGGAGPNHGCPNFDREMGHPLLLKPVLEQFPKLKLWIMHSGDQHYQETIALMKEYTGVYADISVIADPAIVPVAEFSVIMQAFNQAGLTDRLMFGTDNGDIKKITAAVAGLDFLTAAQKENVFYKNAERFFTRK